MPALSATRGRTILGDNDIPKMRKIICFGNTGRPELPRNGKISGQYRSKQDQDWFRQCISLVSAAATGKKKRPRIPALHSLISHIILFWYAVPHFPFSLLFLLINTLLSFPRLPGYTELRPNNCSLEQASLLHSAMTCSTSDTV